MEFNVELNGLDINGVEIQKLTIGVKMEPAVYLEMLKLYPEVLKAVFEVLKAQSK